MYHCPHLKKLPFLFYSAFLFLVSVPDRCEFICVTSSGRPSCRRREPPDRRAFVPKRGILFRKENTPFCCYRPQHCLFSALPRSTKNAGWQLARRWRGNRSYAAYQQAASVTVRSTAYTFFRCRRGRGRCGRSSAPCAAAFLRCRRPRWWRRCPRPRARA